MVSKYAQYILIEGSIKNQDVSQRFGFPAFLLKMGRAPPPQPGGLHFNLPTIGKSGAVAAAAPTPPYSLAQTFSPMCAPCMAPVGLDFGILTLQK